MVLDDFVGDISKPGLGDRKRGQIGVALRFHQCPGSRQGGLVKTVLAAGGFKVFWAARARVIIASMSFCGSVHLSFPKYAKLLICGKAWHKQRVAVFLKRMPFYPNNELRAG